MILSLSHNDLDAFGCQLCILDKFSKLSKIDFYNTNYKDFDFKVNEIIDRIEQNREKIQLLLITDISFTEKRSLLLALKEVTQEFKIKTIFIDHHEYSEGFWDGIETPLFKIHWDKTKSASKITQEVLNITNTNLLKIINIIDIYDIWQDENKFFKVAQNLNNYFWTQGRFNLLNTFIQNNYNLPSNFLETCNNFYKEAEISYEKSKKKNLIIHPRKDISFSFTDEYFNNYVEWELQYNKVFVCAAHYGLVRLRFKKRSDGYPDDLVKIIKDKILDGSDKGHLHSFSFYLEDVSLDTIVEKFKQIDGIIKTSIEEYSNCRK